MKAFYQKIITEFSSAEALAKFAAVNTNPVNYIDLYKGTFQFEDDTVQIIQPSLFITWDIDYAAKPNSAAITIYACYEQLYDTSNHSQNQQAGLKFLDYATTVDTILMALESETTGKLIKVSEGFHKTDSKIYVYRLSYKCNYSGKEPTEYEGGEYDTLLLNRNLTYDL